MKKFMYNCVEFYPFIWGNSNEEKGVKIHTKTCTKQTMKLSIAFLLAFWYPIFLSVCFTSLYCYCCNPCASLLGRKRKKKAPLLPN